MDIEMNKRIKELRIQHGYKSRQAFADDLHVDMSVVKSWEREKNPSMPQLNSLIAMCDLFKCDLDYLVGRIEEHTHAVKTACEVTGLSEKAVKRIKGKVSTEALSHLIESTGFLDLMTSYSFFLELLGNMKNLDLDGPWRTFRQRADGKVVMSNDAAVHHYMNETVSKLNYICESDYNRTVKEKKLRPNPLDYDDLIAEIRATEQEIEYLTGEKEYLEKEVLPTFSNPYSGPSEPIFEHEPGPDHGKE